MPAHRVVDLLLRELEGVELSMVLSVKVMNPMSRRLLSGRREPD